MRIILSVLVLVLLLGFNKVHADPGHGTPALYNYTGIESFSKAWNMAMERKSHWATEHNKGPCAFFVDGIGRIQLHYCVNDSPTIVYVFQADCNDTANLTRTYTGQMLTNGFSSLTQDVERPECIPLNEAPCNAMLIYYICCPDGMGYQAYWVDRNTDEVFATGQPPCDDGNYEWLDYSELSQPEEPTPVASPSPQMPTPTPPEPNPTPEQSPVPSPMQTIPEPSPIPSPTGNNQNPNPIPTPEFHATAYPIPLGTTGESSFIDSNIDDIEYDDSVPDVGQDQEEDDSWLDTIFDMFSNHPLIDVIRNSGITTSNELCSLSVNLYGKTIEISFCDLTEYFDIFGYFVFVCASIYAYFIIFRVS